MSLPKYELVPDSLKYEIAKKHFKEDIMQKDLAAIYKLPKWIIQRICTQFSTEMYKEKKVTTLEAEAINHDVENIAAWYDGILTVGDYKPHLHEKFLQHL